MYDDYGFYIGDGGGLESIYGGGWDFPMQDSYSWDFTCGGGYDAADMVIPNLSTPDDPMFQGDLGGGVPSESALAQLSAAGSENNAAAIARMQAAVEAGGAPDPQDLRVMY